MGNKIIKVYTLFACVFAFLSLNGQTRELEVPFLTQQPNTKWCWAASPAMVISYYGYNSSTCGNVEWVRLNVPNTYLGNSNCCGQPTPSLCNQALIPPIISTILTHYGLSSTFSYGNLSLADVKNVIDDNRPLIMGVSKNTGASHEMVIIGYNNSDLYYIDPWDGYHINTYTDATTIECLGAYFYVWDLHTFVLTSNVCPSNISLHYTIGASANIHAQVSLTIDAVINNNSTVSLISGNNISFNPGFEIQTGSTLTANVISNPCQ